MACHTNTTIGTTSIFTTMFSLLRSDSTNFDTDSISLALPCVRGLDPLPQEYLTTASHKKARVNSACPHSDRKHYAKNMCNYCYHKNGRSGRATNCPHQDRPLYAKGQCHYCYLLKYNKTVTYRRRRSRQRD